MSEEPLSTGEKVTSLTIGLFATAAAIELAFRLLLPAPTTFNNESDEYPTNPRDYFEELRREDGAPVYGVPLTLSPDSGERLGSPANPTAKPRILGLGDSQGMGQGVRYEDTAYDRMTTLLAAEGFDARVINRAVRGYDIEEVVERAKIELAEASYDVVLYWLVLDDFGLAMPPRPNRKPSISAAAEFFSHTAAQWTVSNQTTEAYLNAFTGSSLDNGARHLQSLHALSVAHNATLVVAIMPLLYDFERYPFGPIHTTLRDVCTAQGIACVDLLAPLYDLPASSLWVHPIDHHPNELAHGRIATFLTETIVQNGWLDTRQAPSVETNDTARDAESLDQP